MEGSDRQPLERSSRHPLEPGNRQSLERSSRQPLEAGDRQPLEAGDRQPLERSSRQPLEPGDSQPLERSSRQPLEPGNRQPLERSSRQPLEPGDRQPLGTSERQQHESRLEEGQLSSVWITDSSPEPLSPGVSGIMFVNHYFVYETHLGKRKIMLELRLYTCKIHMSATLYILVYLSPQSYKLNNSICTPLDTAIKLCISLLYYSSLMLMMLCCTMACS